MKKLFNHTKKPVEGWKDYDENDYDWDGSDYEEYGGEEPEYFDEAENYPGGEYGIEAYGAEAEDHPEDGYGIEAGSSPEEEYVEAAGGYSGEEYVIEAENYPGGEYAAEAEDYLEEEYGAVAESSPEEEYVEAAGGYPGEEYAVEAENYPDEEYAAEAEGYPGEEYAAEAEGYPGEEYAAEAEGYPGEEYAAEAEGYPGEEYAAEAEGYPGDGYGIEAGSSPEEEYGEAAGNYPEEEYSLEAAGLYPEEEYVAETEDYPGEGYSMEAESSPEEGYAAEAGPDYYKEGRLEERRRPRAPKGKKRPSGGFLYKLQQGAGSMSGIDRVILGTGVAVLVLALVTGGLYISSRIVDNQVADFAGVGSQLDGIHTIGGEGLLAVADAELARIAALETVQDQVVEPPREYQEAEYGRNITVTLNLTSVQKDLKIKFINQANGKLISNVPFVVTVTGPDGKSVVWSDDDMDGIIYKKDITPGSYTVVMEALSDEKYSDYMIPGDSQKVEVKKDIDYKKVDVSNEIKKESEVNAAKEDTKQNVTVVESSLPDTVEWVESKVIDATYNEVSRSAIPDPATLVSAGAPTGVMETMTTVSGPNPPLTLQGITLDKTDVTVFSTAAVTVNATLSGAATAAPTVSAVSADSNVAAVSVSGTAVTVTGGNEGSTAVTVSYTENGQTVSASLTVTVKSHPREDRITKLKDADGNQLYVLENGAYREAVYADYYTAESFFVKGNAKYSGWQTLNGKVYYFNAAGEMVTGEQVIQGARYNFASDGTLVTGSGDMGIDVSKWNGNIDWNAVSNSGVSYVIIRCGYRGSSQGKLIEDPKFTANIQGATAAGLKVGVYFFTQAVDEVEAVEEASMVLEQIKGYKISYPVFLDVEPSGGRADSIDRATRTAVCRAFCETIQGAGYTAGIYANKTWLTGKLNAGELGSYKIWLAQYAASPTYTGRYDLWQYKSTGSVSGIKGKVDMNLSYLGY